MNLIYYVGLDVHNESIAVSIAPGDSTEVRRYGIIGGSHEDVLRLPKKLQTAHPDTELRFCCKAGYAIVVTGFPSIRSYLRCNSTNCLACRCRSHSSDPRSGRALWESESSTSEGSCVGNRVRPTRRH